MPSSTTHFLPTTATNPLIALDIPTISTAAPTMAPQDSAPLLDNIDKEPKDLLVAHDESTSSVARLLDFLFARSTYYWIAFIAQFCHLVLGVIGLCVIFSLRKNGINDVYYEDDLFMFISTSSWSAMSLIILAFLLYYHYKGSGNLRSLAGYQHSFMLFCSFFNGINCFLVAQPFVTGKRELIFEDNIRAIIIPLMVGFLFVVSGACFVATRIIYRSAVNARGTETVPFEIQVPAWRLATTEESHIYRRSGGGVKLSA